MTWQDKTRQGKTKHFVFVQTRQNKTRRRQDKTKAKTRYDNGRQDKTWQGKAT